MIDHFLQLTRNAGPGKYACACGMSFFVSDTKGDRHKAMGPWPGTAPATRWRSSTCGIPTRSDGCNFMALANR